MNFPNTSSPRKARPWILFCVIVCLALLPELSAVAQNASGAFSLSPVNAPGLVLEAVGAGTSDGTVVSIGSPTGDAKQKWNFIARGNNAYVIRPSYSPNLVLAPRAAGTNNGTDLVLQTETDKPTQIWTIRANENGSFSFMPQYAPTKALDDLQGSQVAGARQDIWDFDPHDPHVQWTLKPLDGATMPTLAIPPHIPAGTIKEFTFNTSTIFPGTQRNGVVFIPAQYDASKPACVYVEQDGYNPEYRTMLEQLIAAKDMPVTVGVFVWPGDVHAPAGSTGVRRNRSFEYDGVSDNYVRFLTEEILPYVAKTFNLNLSTSGNDRCIAGASSGGISAFNAAWLRPDQFSRVYACSGSFTAFRGGNEFPTLVRKTEAKPIRVYLTTATQDMENCAGDWYLIDQEMDKALRFSGYDYSYHVVEGGHTAGWIEHFPDAMRFIWKDWPAAIPEGTSAPRVRDVLIDGEKWSVAADGCQDPRSPACNSKGEIFFVDPPVNKLYRIGLDGKASVFLDDAAHADGLSIGPKDELYTVSRTTGNLLSYDASNQGHVVTSGLPGQYVLARPDGGLYVTTTGTKPGQDSQVWFVKDGKKTQVDSGLKSATGLAYRPDQWLLSVADGGSKWVYSYQIANDGSLASKERFFCLQVPDWEDDAGAESVCYAQEGQMLVGTRSGVQICADDGPTQVILPLPDRSRVVGVALGGPDLHTLYALAGGKIWKRVVKIHAGGAFSPAVPVNATPL
jgi:enterochelin esterase-like enzyme/sugar lactone lactonase YvrE